VVIRVELNRETEARLLAQAQQQGVPLEDLAERLLREAASAVPRPRRPLSVERFHAMIRSLAEGSEGLPDLRTEGFTRDSFYEGR
jgi:hypothetical protein